MFKDLKYKNVVLTGGSGFIGKQITNMLWGCCLGRAGGNCMVFYDGKNDGKIICNVPITRSDLI